MTDRFDTGLASAEAPAVIVRPLVGLRNSMSTFAPLTALMQRFAQQTPLRASSLIITLYGDAIEPHGGTAWLGSLAALLEPMGINERLVRTSVFRLAKEQWLTAEKVGRRSYYSLTGVGRRRFETAFRKVYSAGSPAWDGSWHLVMLPRATPEKRRQVREELEWQGYGLLAQGVMASPRAERADLLATLREQGVEDEAIVFRTEALDTLAAKALRVQVRESWNLDALGRHYEEFLSLFRPLWAAIREAVELTPQECFLARLLLIHEYRKLVLRDPELPEALLPSGWEGRAARQLCRNLYRALCPGAEQWLSQALETADGPVPGPMESFFRRFGGLAD